MEISNLTGVDCGYRYRLIPPYAANAAFKKYSMGVRTAYAKHAKAWDDEQNTIWVVRNYLAIKLILASSVMLSSSEYSEEMNVRMSIPYLNYYAILNCCRAFLLTSPYEIWKGKTSVQRTHQSILNAATGYLRGFYKDADKKWGNKILLAREQRELFSYRFPAQGLSFLRNGPAVTTDDAVEICTILSELAQLQSECLQAALEKHVGRTYKILDTPDIALAVSYDVFDFENVDLDDAYRISYYTRKMSAPLALSIMATKGLVEDFFGAWCSEEEQDLAFNPDENWQIIFDFE